MEMFNGASLRAKASPSGMSHYPLWGYIINKFIIDPPIIPEGDY
jgi:hypothetical protein